MEIQKSLTYGWEKLKEIWWWVSLSILYLQIGGLLYLFAGFTAMKFTGEPEFLSKLSYNSFQSYLSSGLNSQNIVGYFIALFIMFLMLYFFAGYLPSKKAANKNHKTVMAKVAVWFFIINALIMLFSVLIMKLSNPSHPGAYSKAMVIYRLFSQFSAIFGAALFIVIALISYIYKKFSERSAFQISIVYFIFALIPIVISSTSLFTTYLPSNHGSPRPVSPLFGFIEVLISFVIYSVEVFVLPETVLQDDLKKGFQRGLYLMKEKGRIIFFYLMLYALYFVVFYATSFISLKSRVLSPVFMAFYQWFPGMIEAFIVLSSFRLAYFFENRDELFEESSSDENQD